jgi:hypothetical protein
VMKWVQEWLPRTRALTVTPLYVGEGDRGVYEVGRWRLDLTARDPSLTGVHNFVFRRDGTGEYHVVSMYIYSDSEPARVQHRSP